MLGKRAKTPSDTGLSSTNLKGLVKKADSSSTL